MGLQPVAALLASLDSSLGAGCRLSPDQSWLAPPAAASSWRWPHKHCPRLCSGSGREQRSTRLSSSGWTENTPSSSSGSGSGTIHPVVSHPQCSDSAGHSLNTGQQPLASSSTTTHTITSSHWSPASHYLKKSAAESPLNYPVIVR